MSQNHYQTLPPEFNQAFKPADIRAIYPTQIDETVAYRTARAFVELYDLKQVVVGRDMRVSSPALHQAFLEGLTDQGADVIDLGLVDTPAVYYASGTYDCFGAMITASHNPKEYNGIKLVKQQAVPLTDDLEKLQERVIEGTFNEVGQKGRVIEKNILPEYQEYVRSLVSVQSPRTISVVADAGNGMATVLQNAMTEGFPVELHPLFFELDGTFPNRGSNPTLQKNIGPIQNKIVEVQADFGVAFDGDVDRVAFFDETGKLINSAVIGAMIVKHLQTQSPNEPLAMTYTNFTSRTLRETIEAGGSTALWARVGHAFIKKAMRQSDAVFGSEHSAHFYFKQNFYADSGILTFLYVLAMYGSALSEGKKFSDLVRKFQKYHQGEDTLLYVNDKKCIMEKALNHFEAMGPLHLDMRDGLHVVFDDYWFTLKESTTEDALKFIVESREEDLTQAKHQELLDLVQSFDKTHE